MINGVGDWFRALLGFTSLYVLVALAWRIIANIRIYHYSQTLLLSVIWVYNFGLLGRVVQLVFEENSPFSFWLVWFMLANIGMITYLYEPKSRWRSRIGRDVRRGYGSSRGSD